MDKEDTHTHTQKTRQGEYNSCYKRDSNGNENSVRRQYFDQGAQG